MSKRLAPVAIISIAQQARPKVIGHMLDCRAQLIACSSDVVMTLSSNRPSSQPMGELRMEVESVFVQDRQLTPPVRGGPGLPGPLGRQASHPVEVAAPPQVG